MDYLKVRRFPSNTGDMLLSAAVKSLEASKDVVAAVAPIPGLGVILNLMVEILHKIQVCTTAFESASGSALTLVPAIPPSAECELKLRSATVAMRRDQGPWEYTCKTREDGTRWRGAVSCRITGEGPCQQWIGPIEQVARESERSGEVGVRS